MSIKSMDLNIKTSIIKEGLHTEKVYVDRVKQELEDIKFLGFENYFLTLQKTLKISENGTNKMEQKIEQKRAAKIQK